MKVTLFWGLLLCLSSNVMAQISMDWVVSLGGNGADFSSKIVTDQQANVYGVGHFYDTLNNLVSYGNADVVVFKYSASGNLLWLQHLGSSGEDSGKDIAIDDNGYLYVTGHCRNTFYFGNDSLVSNSNTDAFVAKLDSQGNVLWLKGIGAAGYETGNSIACDNIGNVIVGGTFEDTLAIDNQALLTYGALNNFIIKLDNTGTLVWHNSLSTPTFNNIQDIKLDASGNAYIMGYFRGILYGTLGQLMAYGNDDVLFAKFSANGQLLWWQKIGGIYPDLGFALHIDSPYVYITGVYQDTAFFDSHAQVSEGEFDAFLAQYDLLGNRNWVQHIGGLDDSKGLDIATLENGNVYWVGYFEGTAKWGIDSITSRNPRHVPSDIFIAEYSSNGTYLGIKAIGNVWTDLATGISIADSNNIYITGVYQDSVNFDSTQMISNMASLDMFVVKYSKENWTSWQFINNPSLNALIFPNPMQESTRIEFDLLNVSSVEVVLYNNWGQPMMQLMDCLNCIGTQQINLEKNQLAAGMYYISIHTQNKRAVLPLVVY